MFAFLIQERLISSPTTADCFETEVKLALEKQRQQIDEKFSLINREDMLACRVETRTEDYVIKSWKKRLITLHGNLLTIAVHQNNNSQLSINNNSPQQQQRIQNETNETYDLSTCLVHVRLVTPLTKKGSGKNAVIIYPTQFPFELIINVPNHPPTTNTTSTSDSSPRQRTATTTAALQQQSMIGGIHNNNNNNNNQTKKLLFCAETMKLRSLWLRLLSSRQRIIEHKKSNNNNNNNNNNKVETQTSSQGIANELRKKMLNSQKSQWQTVQQISKSKEQIPSRPPSRTQSNQTPPPSPNASVPVNSPVSFASIGRAGGANTVVSLNQVIELLSKNKSSNAKEEEEVQKTTALILMDESQRKAKEEERQKKLKELFDALQTPVANTNKAITNHLALLSTNKLTLPEVMFIGLAVRNIQLILETPRDENEPPITLPDRQSVKRGNASVSKLNSDPNVVEAKLKSLKEIITNELTDIRNSLQELIGELYPQTSELNLNDATNLAKRITSILSVLKEIATICEGE